MKAVTTAVLLAGLATCGAMADAPPVRTPEQVQVVFESLDRNDDQRISQREAARKQTLRKRFAGVDADSDGYLSRAEFAARPSPERFE